MTTSAHPRARLQVAPAALGVAIALLAARGWLETRGGAPTPAALVDLGALERSRVWAGELWRFAVAPFLLPSTGLLALEAGAVLLAGSALERRAGRAAFLTVYVAAAVGGAAAALLARDAVVAGTGAGALGLLGALGLFLARGAGFERGLALRMVPLAAAVVADAAAPAAVREAAGWDPVGAEGLAQIGGLLAGWAVALPFASPSPRWRARLHAAAAAVALAATVAAASVPREGPTLLEEDALVVRLHDALSARRVDGALRLVEDGERRGFRSPGFTVYRAIVRGATGDLEGGLALLRPLQGSALAPVREEAARQVARMAHELGYRHYAGDGRPLDPHAGLAYFEEACRAGNDEACGNVDWIRTGRAPAPPP